MPPRLQFSFPTLGIPAVPLRLLFPLTFLFLILAAVAIRMVDRGETAPLA